MAVQRGVWLAHHSNMTHNSSHADSIKVDINHKDLKHLSADGKVEREEYANLTTNSETPNL